jgi:hypothetical protein
MVIKIRTLVVFCRVVETGWKRGMRDPAIPLLGIYPKDCDTGYSRSTCTAMFIAALFTIAKNYGSSQDAPLLMNGSRKCGIYTQWNFMQP